MSKWENKVALEVNFSLLKEFKKDNDIWHCFAVSKNSERMKTTTLVWHVKYFFFKKNIAYLSC